MDATQIIMCFLLIITVADSANNISTCLIWSIENKTFLLTFRTQNFSESLSFHDKSGKEQANCRFSTTGPLCRSVHPYGNVTADTLQKKITFLINEFAEDYVNGLWFCLQGREKYFNFVSTKMGIINDTKQYFYGNIKDSNTIELVCSSCREPDGNYVEFLINNETYSSVSYSHDTNTCRHGSKECSPGVCSCTVSGNAFTFIYRFTKNNEKSFSCEMRYVDNVYKSRFMKVTTVYYNGTHLISKGTKTIITKRNEKIPLKEISDKDVTDKESTAVDNVTYSRDESNDKDEDSTTVDNVTYPLDESNDEGFPFWCIPVAVLAVVITIVVVFVLFKCIKRKEFHEKNKRNMNEVKFAEMMCNEKPDTTEESSLLNSEDMTQNQVPQSSLKKSCAHCLARKENRIAIMWCMECGEALCILCKNHHDSMQICRGHTIVEINKVPANFNMNSETYCIDHPNFKHDYFCKDDDELFCKECVGTKHRKCSNTMPLLSLDIETHMQQLLTKNNKRVTYILGRLDTLKNFHMEHNTKINDDATKIKKLLSTSAMKARQPSESDEIKTSFAQQFKKSNLKELKMVKDICMRDNSKIIDYIEKQIIRVNEQEDFIKFVSEYGSPKLLFVLIHNSVKATLKNVDDEIGKIIDHGPPTLHFQRIEIIQEPVLDALLRKKEPCQVQVHVKAQRESLPLDNKDCARSKKVKGQTREGHSTL